MIALIDEDIKNRKRFEAALHGLRLEGDDETPAVPARNRSHGHLERMKARRLRRAH